MPALHLHTASVRMRFNTVPHAPFSVARGRCTHKSQSTSSVLRLFPLLLSAAALLVALACAEPLHLLPATDASLTDSRPWCDAACSHNSDSGAAPATCAATAFDYGDEALCEEFGLQPRAPDASLHGVPVPPQRVIIDSFMFNNEFDVLLVRLQELAPVVDYFILVEADVSHSGMHKPALFAQHSHLFHAFAAKVVHVQLHASDFAAATKSAAAQKKSWAWEEYSRAAVARGLQQIELKLQRSFTQHDVVMVTDVDELPSRAVARALRSCNVQLPAKLSMMFFYYSLRCVDALRYHRRVTALRYHRRVTVLRYHRRVTVASRPQVDMARPRNFGARAVDAAVRRAR
jgi:hypothetical protein